MSAFDPLQTFIATDFDDDSTLLGRVAQGECAAQALAFLTASW
jgi:hypothetical protein